MRTSKISLVKSKFMCGRCSMQYVDYKRLLEHLYWRHGTESVWCTQCEVKRWPYATHKCHVLPISFDFIEDSGFKSGVSSDYSERETEFCYCGKYMDDAPMIGCDGPSCHLQWYHFSCVGITSAPAGDWLCPSCESQKINQTNLVKMGAET